MAPKAPKATKKILTFPGSSYAPLVMERCFRAEAFVPFEKNRTEADVQFELSSSSSGEAIPREHQTSFMDHKEGEGILLHSRSVLRMVREKRGMLVRC